MTLNNETRLTPSGTSGSATGLHDTFSENRSENKSDMKWETRRRRVSNCSKLLDTFQLKFHPNKGSLVGFLEAFRAWIRRMEEQEGKISDDDQGTMLMACLSDKARTSVQGKRGAIEIERQLKDCFLRDAITLGEEMKDMRQEEGESVAKWVSRLHAVASEMRAVDNKFTEENERDIFFDGLHKAMKEKLHVHGPRNFRKTKELALGIEALGRKIERTVEPVAKGANKMFAGRMDNETNNNNNRSAGDSASTTRKSVDSDGNNNNNNTGAVYRNDNGNNNNNNSNSSNGNNINRGGGVTTEILITTMIVNEEMEENLRVLSVEMRDTLKEIVLGLLARNVGSRGICRRHVEPGGARYVE